MRSSVPLAARAVKHGPDSGPLSVAVVELRCGEAHHAQAEAGCPVDLVERGVQGAA